MKKLFLAIAVVGFLVSCDNAANTEARAKDSLDSIEKLQKESVNEAADAAKTNIDSTIEMKKDSVDAIHDVKDSTNH
jgi:DNA phosphorothioation-dependent restriction protein DptG